MKILVTGSAGFIGYSLCKTLLQKGYEIIGLDNHNNYYDTKLKDARLNILLKYNNYKHYKTDISNSNALEEIFKKHEPNKVINLAAQAGVRYSMKNPLAYINSNIFGFINVLENCRYHKVDHLIYASTSSVYGANSKMPFSEHDSANHPLSLYAASKKSNELIAHSYSHLYQIPTTGLRFFTVYGPWGRPDMALFKFTKGIINKKKIDIYNHGKMYRDFTYIDDIVNGISALINKAPNKKQFGKIKNDSLSPVAPFRIINIGNTSKVYLMDFINILEKELGIKATRNYMPIQKGDVKITLSDTTLLKKLTRYNPRTNYKIGIKKFLKWYLTYYNK